MISTFWLIIVIASLGIVLACIWALWRQHKSLLQLRSIISSFQSPLLFYDRHDRLRFYSPGLIIFKKESIRSIRLLATRPAPGQTLLGQLELDFNLYRTRSKLLEYKPGQVGTVVFLEYTGPSPANNHAKVA
jgi:hypothetical protein